MIRTAPYYIIPGTYLENIAFLDGTDGEGRFPGLGGVELLFFIFDPETDELYAKERTGVEAYADRFIFTVHMPDNLEPGHEGIVAMTEDLARQYV
ncbi:MAG: AP endonuclease, partial [Spirochaetales bacterium]